MSVEQHRQICYFPIVRRVGGGGDERVRITVRVMDEGTEDGQGTKRLRQSQPVSLNPNRTINVQEQIIQQTTVATNHTRPKNSSNASTNKTECQRQTNQNLQQSALAQVDKEQQKRTNASQNYVATRSLFADRSRPRRPTSLHFPRSSLFLPSSL